MGHALKGKVAGLGRAARPVAARLGAALRRLITSRTTRVAPFAAAIRAGAAAVRSAFDVRRTRSAPGVTAGWHRPLVGFAALMVVWGAGAAVGIAVDPRTLNGASVWAKPEKFAISLGIYSATLAWMQSLFSRPALQRVGWWVGTFGALASLLEMSVITLQSMRGVGSHFNISTPLNARLYLVMGLALPAFYGVIVIIGILLVAFRQLPDDRSIAWALRSGLTVGVAGLSIGFAMGRPTPEQRAERAPTTWGSHSVGGDDPTGGLPFLGWNTRHGDLRVPHFIGMHALQGLPLLALGLKALLPTRLSEATRLRIVLTAGATWTAALGTALWQALRGESIRNPGARTGSAVAAIALLVVGAAGRIARYAEHHPVGVPSAIAP